jgi:hypothetical protein
MKITITINVDNAAFEDAGGSEVARILRELDRAITTPRAFTFSRSSRTSTATPSGPLTSGRAEMTFTLTIACDNAAFVDDREREVSHIMADVLAEIDQGLKGGICRDTNGNRVGEWSFN